MKLITATESYDLTALDPPEGLSYAYLAGCEIRDAINHGELEYTLPGIKEWTKGSRDRQTKVDAVTTLVRGKRLTDLEQCFIDHYMKYIDSSPAAKASRIVLQEELKQGATIETMFPILLPVLT